MRWAPLAAVRCSWWSMILREHDTEPTEMMGGLLNAVIGLWLLWPAPTLPPTGAFAQLGAGPEWLWGAIFLLVGAGHLSALQSGERAWRRSACLGAFAIWFGLAATSLWLAPHGLGFPFFMVLGVAQAWAYIRLGQAPV